MLSASHKPGKLTTDLAMSAIKAAIVGACHGGGELLRLLLIIRIVARATFRRAYG